MSWYDTGTIAVTNGSATVTGTVTNFVSGARVGDGIKTPDGEIYEIASINSATSITLGQNYNGSTTSGAVYSIVPTQSLTAQLAADVTTLISDYQTNLDTISGAVFKATNGTVSAPSITFANDLNTGLYSIADNNLGVAVSGVKQMDLLSTSVKLNYSGSTKLSTTATGIDVTGTVVADGLTVENAKNTSVITLSSTTNDASWTPTTDFYGKINFDSDDGSGGGVGTKGSIRVSPTSATGTNDQMIVSVASSAGLKDRLSIDGETGDISFYEDTGTTAKFFWDASAESLGIGTSSPRTQLDISATSPTITLTSPAITWAGGEVLGGIDWFTLDSSGIGAHEIGNIFLEQTGSSTTPTVDMVFTTSTTNANPTERLRIDSSGAVLIQTSDARLRGGDTTGRLVLSNSDTTSYITVNGSANASPNELALLTSTNLKFHTGATYTERMRIDSSGNLLVGGTTAKFFWDASAESLKVGHATASYSAKLDIVGDGTGVRSPILWARSGTGDAVHQININGTNLEFGYGGTLDTTPYAVFDGSGNLLVGTTNTNPATNNVAGTAIRWTGTSGQVSVTAASANPINANRTGTDGDIATFRKDGTTVGSISVTGSATAYNTSSDYRLKENVVPMDDAASRVLALKPCRFNFIADPENAVDGFLAHEAQEVVPEAVHGVKDGMRTEEYEVSPAVEATYDEEGNELTPYVPAVMGTREVPEYQGIDQSKLVPLLTKALQESLKRIAALEAKVGV